MSGQRTGLGFLSPGENGGDYFEEYDSWWDNFTEDGDYIYTGGGSSWWDNFDPYTGDYAGGGGSNDTWNDFFNWYLEQGYDPFDAAAMADAETTGESFVINTLEPGSLPPIPDDLPGVIPAPYDPFTIPLPDWFANDPAPPPPLPPLPGYCPGGYYHPVSDPFKCVPFPPESKPAARRAAQQKAQQQQQQAQKRQQQQQQPCPQGQMRYPYTGKCVPQQCPQGTRRNPATGECVKNAQQGPLPQCPANRVYDLQKKKCVVPGSSSGSSNSWLWLLLIAGGAVVISKRKS